MRRAARAVLAASLASYAVGVASVVAVALAGHGLPTLRAALGGGAALVVLACHGTVSLRDPAGAVGALQGFPAARVKGLLPLIAAPVLIAVVRSARRDRLPALGYGVALMVPALAAALGARQSYPRPGGTLSVSGGPVAAAAGALIGGTVIALLARLRRVPRPLAVAGCGLLGGWLAGLLLVGVGVVVAAAAGTPATTLVEALVGAPTLAVAATGLGLGVPVTVRVHRAGGQDGYGRTWLLHPPAHDRWLLWCVLVALAALAALGWATYRTRLRARSVPLTAAAFAVVLVVAARLVAVSATAAARVGSDGGPVTHPQRALLELPPLPLGLTAAAAALLACTAGWALGWTGRRPVGRRRGL